MQADPLKASDWERVEELFPDLLALPPGERPAFLDRECAGAPLVRAELESLVRAAEADSVLDHSPVLTTAAAPLPGATLSPGDRLGAWRVIAPLGRGGMGEVYLAGRSEGGFAQRAAIKLLRPEAAAHAERFDAERSILAQLEHPNVARLLDGGRAPDGRAYMAMEFVDGESLDAYCRRSKATLDERLDLFTQICGAVAYAHANLVIHRDLKPANIMVTGEGAVKLLDFGVAKLLDLRSNQTTAAAPFTPEHAAPEQLEGGPITTSVDIHALGVILYELLCGRRPWSFGETPLSQMIDRLLRDEPPLPSKVAAGETDPPVPARLLAGDLDAIVHKCLRKLPADRYPTVEALARDVQRWRRREPVSARRGNIVYHLRRWFVRHRLTATAAMLGLAAVLVGSTLAVWQFREARSAAARSERTLDFLVGVFEQADPGQSQHSQATARDLLAAGEARIETDLADDPGMQAELERTLARIFQGLGEYERAAGLARRALARTATDDWAGRAETLVLLGNALVQQRNGEGAKVLDEAVTLYLEHEGPDSLNLAQARLGLGVAYGLLGQREPARVMQARAHEVLARVHGPAHPDVARAAQYLGQTEEMLGNYEEAERLYRGALDGLAQHYGGNHSRVGEMHADLGGLLDRIGRREEAEAELKAAAGIFRAVYGDGHPRLAFVLFSQSILFIGQARYEEADAALLETLRIYPADSYLAAQSQRYLALSLTRQGRLNEAEQRLVAAAEVMARQATAQDPQRYRVQADLAGVKLRLGRAEEAEPMLREAAEAIAAITGPESYEIRAPLKLRGEALLALSRAPEAETVLAGLLGFEEKLLGAEHRDIATTRRLLALARLANGDAPAARATLEPALAIGRAQADGKVLAPVLLASARIALAEADPARATREATEALSLDPTQSPEVQSLLTQAKSPR